MSLSDLQNLHDYIEFKIDNPEFKGCAVCRELQKDEDDLRDCERCSEKFGPKGIVELNAANLEVWDLAEEVYYLGADLAINLRGGLRVDQEEAYWLRKKLVTVMQYFKYLEMKNSPRML